MRMIPALFLLAALCFFLAPGSILAAVTFNGEIAPIIYKNCSSCHRPGEAAPFPLLSYEDVVKKSKMIVKVTKSRSMPPWKAEPLVAIRKRGRLRLPRRHAPRFGSRACRKDME